MSVLRAMMRVLPPKLAWELRRLRASRRRNVAQIGQDFWVAGEVFNGKRHGYFVDIGAADGYDISNTLLLETRYQWNGICVEANPDSMVNLLACRRVTCVNACVDGSARTVAFRKNGLFGGIVAPDEESGADGAEGVVRMQSVTLMELLNTYRAPRIIDYLSIDVEGAEEGVLAGFDFSKFTFRCMTVERPSQRLRDVLSGNDYQLVKDVPGLDAFFVHRSFVEDYARNALAFWSGRF